MTSSLVPPLISCSPAVHEAIKSLGYRATWVARRSYIGSDSVLRPAAYLPLKAGSTSMSCEKETSSVQSLIISPPYLDSIKKDCSVLDICPAGTACQDEALKIPDGERSVVTEEENRRVLSKIDRQ